jgi:CCR4-NOT transcription complex subunit 9
MQDHGPHARLLQLQSRQAGPEEVKIWALVMDLTNPACRETALLELSKKREQYEDLALVLWHSFGSY